MAAAGSGAGIGKQWETGSLDKKGFRARNGTRSWTLAVAEEDESPIPGRCQKVAAGKQGEETAAQMAKKPGGGGRATPPRSKGATVHGART